MKLKVTLAATPFFFLLAFLPIYSQGSNGLVDSFANNTALSEGVKLSKKKKFDPARKKFEESSRFWQAHHTSSLYLTILNDVTNNRLKKKNAANIFKAVHEELNAKSKKALKQINKVVKQNEGYFPAHIIHADILVSRENYEKAEKAFTEAINLAPDIALPYIFRAKFYAKLSRSEEAIADMTRAITLDPAYGFGYFERGFTYCLQREYDKAIKDFEIAIRRHPDWEHSTVVIEAYHNRGVERIQKKSYRKAIADFDRAIEIDPEYLNSYLSRARAYKKLKSYTKALKDFKHCIKSNPDFKEAYYQRALLHSARRHYTKATTDFRAALKLSPKDTKLSFKIAESYYKADKYKKAIIEFNRVIELDQRYFWAYYWKGYAHKSLRQPKQAVRAFQNFLNNAPTQYYKQIMHAELEIKKLQR